METSTMGFLSFLFLLLIWIALFLVWSFTIWDIFRRHDMSGWAKAGWFLFVIIVPLIGTLVYLLTHPKPPTHEYAERVEGSSPVSTAQQLETLAKLKEAGHLTEEEFAAQKAKLS